MDSVERIQGKPQVVVLYCWERYTARDLSPPLVTAVDPDTGILTEIETPKYNTPQGAAFWKPVFDELRERFARRELADALMIGAFGDFNTPSEEQVQTLKDLTGGVPWVAQGHGRARDIHDEPVGYCTTVWGAFGPADPRENRLYGWRGEKLVCQFARDMFANAPLPEYRQLLEWNIAGNQRGIGRVGADFWEVLSQQDKSNRGGYSGGGRLYYTAMATMILEVYYRHLPIYRQQSTEEAFPE